MTRAEHLDVSGLSAADVSVLLDAVAAVAEHAPAVRVLSLPLKAFELLGRQRTERLVV